MVFPTDADLVMKATAGDKAAFAELYRRHAEAAWHLAQAVTRNVNDAADAVSDAFTRVMTALSRGTFSPTTPFRPYLLAATRNAAIDVLRRAGRLEATDVDALDQAGGAEPPDRVVAAEDAELVSRAFKDLPERWRSVLWLTEVEGIPARQAAVQLGLSPNGTAQLAVRARAGLRERYLQAHLRDVEHESCRRTVDHLGAYVAGALPPRDVAKVDQHLVECEDCRRRLDDLRDLGAGMRRAVLPLPAALAAKATGSWKAAATALPRGKPVGNFLTRLPRNEAALRALGTAAAGVFVLGVIGATMSDHHGVPSQPFAAPAPVDEVVDASESPTSPVAAPPAPPVDDLLSDDSLGTGLTRGASAGAVAASTTTTAALAATTTTIGPIAPTTTLPRGVADQDDDSSGFGGGGNDNGGGGGGSDDGGGDDGGGGPLPPPPTTPTTQPPSPQPEPEAQVGVGGRLGGGSGSVSVGAGDGSCTDLSLVGSSLTGCSDDAPEDDGVSASTGGKQLPKNTLNLP